MQMLQLYLTDAYQLQIASVTIMRRSINLDSNPSASSPALHWVHDIARFHASKSIPHQTSLRAPPPNNRLKARPPSEKILLPHQQPHHPILTRPQLLHLLAKLLISTIYLLRFLGAPHRTIRNAVIVPFPLIARHSTCNTLSDILETRHVQSAKAWDLMR